MTRDGATNCRPRLGFLGLGWIGQKRMRALVERDLADVVAVADPSPSARLEASAHVPGARSVATFEELLEEELDGVVLATPSALHASQTLRALERGLSVFCQKPLGRSAAEVVDVVSAARRADRLLGVDMSYRHTRALECVRELVASGELGSVYVARLVFHNAYGPDKDWYYTRELSGGGCLVDLGIHLVDLALWILERPVVSIRGRLYAQGKRLDIPTHDVEDYASAELELDGGCTVEIACSWKTSAGKDAVISAEFIGPRGTAVFENVDGSFYDFVAERRRGTTREVLVKPPDEWGARALADWVERLSISSAFDESAFAYLETARVLDAIASGRFHP